MADQTIYICLLDCSSIQRYVFGSNLLKSNVGASHVVTEVYARWIPETLSRIFDEDHRAVVERFVQWQCIEAGQDILALQPQKDGRWRMESGTCKKAGMNILALQKNLSLKWETGYVGGGNALMLFREERDAQEFIAQWTRTLLVEAPGIRPVVALMKTTLANIHRDIDSAFENLEESKGRHIAATTLPRHGITAECKLTGVSAEGLHLFPEGLREISSVSKTKLDNFGAANDALEEKFKAVLKGEYQFAYDTENLGQSRHVENHVAIVHIDGNSVGERFKDAKSLFDKRKLSTEVERITTAAMAEMIKALIEKLPVLIDEEKILERPRHKKDHPSNKPILPLRPIILNGDDVTFVTDARLGFFLAEKFMHAFAAPEVQTLDKPLADDRKYLSSCAGIAIIKTKYPFYRGYQLAERLCGKAKQKGRVDNTSWLDFHISHRGLASSLSEMREEQYTAADHASLLWRPWQITMEKSAYSFEQLKHVLRELLFSNKEKYRWPKRKLHELAEVLPQGRDRTKAFLDIARARGLELPQIVKLDNVHNDGWQADDGKLRTPYCDALEVMEFYPECLLRNEGA